MSTSNGNRKPNFKVYCLIGALTGLLAVAGCSQEKAAEQTSEAPQQEKAATEHQTAQATTDAQPEADVEEAPAFPLTNEEEEFIAAYDEPVEIPAAQPAVETTGDQQEASDPYDHLGSIWQESEAGWNGKWVRREGTNVFDAEWTHPSGGQVTAVLTVHLNGDSVRVQRRRSSDGNDCNYVGDLSSVGGSVSGTYQCENGGKDRWSAGIK